MYLFDAVVALEIKQISDEIYIPTNLGGYELNEKAFRIKVKKIT